MVCGSLTINLDAYLVTFRNSLVSLLRRKKQQNLYFVILSYILPLQSRLTAQQIDDIGFII